MANRIYETNKPDYSISPKHCNQVNEGSLQLTSVDPLKLYKLLPGNHVLQNNVFASLSAGIYTLLIQDEHNCTRKEVLEIPSESCCDNPFIPTAFTPNGDGRNDFLNILHIIDVDVKQFTVYNRFGNEVFRDNNLWGWDGKYQGHEAEIGTYFYYLRYRCLQSGKEHILKGNFELIR